MARGARQNRSNEELERISAEVARVESNAIGVLEADWAATLGSAPVAIAILGRCILVSSTPNAITLCLSDNKSSRKLESKYLRVNLIDIAQVGRKAFIEAELGMVKISVLSQDLGRNIDNIIKLFRLPPSPTSKKFIEIQLGALANKATACEEEAKRIQKFFDAWREKTDTLYLAVQEEAVGNKVAQEAAKTKLDLKKKKVAESQAAKDAAERNLAHRQHKLAEAIGRRAHMATELEGDTGVVWGTTIGAVTATNPLLGLGLAAVSLFGVWAVDAYCEEAESSHEASWRELKEAQLQSELTELEMDNLVKSGQSLESISSVLYHAIENLQDLQNEIVSLLRFFSNVVGFIEILMRLHRDEFVKYIDAKTVNEITDADTLAMVDEIMRPVATTMKCHFSVMHHVASAYHTISNKHIMPGFVEISAQGLTSTSLTEQDIKEKQKKLIAYQNQGAQSVKAIAQTAQKNLKTNLITITEDAMKGVAF